MRELVASLRHERAHAIEVEADRHGGQELLRDHDGALRNVEVVGALPLDQRRQDAAGHVADVGRPLAEVAVRDGLEGSNVRVDDLRERRLHVDALLPHDAEDAIAQVGVLEHERLGAEDVALARTDPLAHVLLQRGQLRRGRVQRRLEARAFALHLRCLDAPLRRSGRVATGHDESGATRYSRGDARTPEHASDSNGARRRAQPWLVGSQRRQRGTSSGSWPARGSSPPSTAAPWRPARTHAEASGIPAAR